MVIHCLCDLNCYHSSWIVYGEIFRYRTSTRHDKIFAHLESGVIQAVSSLLEIEKKTSSTFLKVTRDNVLSFLPFLWSCSWNTPTGFACTFEWFTMVIHYGLYMAHKDSAILYHLRWWTTTREPPGNSFILASHSFPFLPLFTKILLIFHLLCCMYLWKQRH